MSEVESRARLAPFLWVSSSAFKRILEDLPERQRSIVGWVYVCLAGAASDSLDGNHQGFASTVAKVQAMAGMSRPTFMSAIQTLEALGLLQRQNRTAENGATIGVRWLLLEPEPRPNNRGANGIGRGPEIEQRDCPPQMRAGNTARTKNSASALTRTRMSFRGKQATKGQAETVKNLIEAWNSETGQQRKLFNAGGMTSDAKKVLGAVMSHPEINEPQWMRTMQTLLANPWWNGPPTLGVMFGPGVVDDNLESPARGGARRDKPEPVREETTSPEYQRRMAAESVTERVHREQTGETVPSEEIKPLLIAMERRKRELGRELTSEECEQVGREVHERFSRARA